MASLSRLQLLLVVCDWGERDPLCFSISESLRHLQSEESSENPSHEAARSEHKPEKRQETEGRFGFWMTSSGYLMPLYYSIDNWRAFRVSSAFTRMPLSAVVNIWYYTVFRMVVFSSVSLWNMMCLHWCSIIKLLQHSTQIYKASLFILSLSMLSLTKHLSNTMKTKCNTFNFRQQN